MSDKTPIQHAIEYFAENLCGVQVMINETGGNTPANRITEKLLKQVIADLKKSLPAEKQFALDAFNEGRSQEYKKQRNDYVADFATYYKKYEAHGTI